MARPVNPALSRLLRDPKNADAFDTLTQRLSGSELTTLLMAVFAARVTELRSANLLRQYQQDRFVAPAQVDALNLARIELRALEVAAAEFEAVALAPVAPLGTHMVLGAVPQNNVVSTSRLSEVTADPTNSLALEAALRRGQELALDARSTRVVHLAAVHRVVRAQHFAGPRSFAHFSLLGLVSAGRDSGDFRFEHAALQSQLGALIDLLRLFCPGAIRVSFTPLSDDLTGVCESLANAVSSAKNVACDLWPEREHGRGYYRNLCFKLYMTIDGEEVELGDGGDVWWTQELLQSRKERMVIGGLGLERLAMLV